MLVLTRKQDEFIRIGSDIVIRVMKTSKGTVKLGIQAPASVRVLRGEVVAAMTTEAPAPFEAASFETEDCEVPYEILSFEAVLVQN